MINFFRKIRKRLLSENRISKYLLYAFGEIILVVIGILIALQINNWNQNQLDRNFEKTMLKEVRSALTSDLEVYEIMQERASMKQEGIQELLQMIASEQTYPDTVLLKSYTKMSFGVQFNYNKGGYEAIKSVGLDKVSNDSLRQGLIVFYEHHFPRAEKFFNSVDEFEYNKKYQLDLHNALWKRISIQLANGSWKLVSRPINSEAFLEQPELIDRIKIAQDNLSSINGTMGYLKYIMDSCSKLVENELNKM
ncbi:DUF6090 family protein [Flagellimonas sp. S3867]|uniref:DUF6090 family protein n=1 Tax=Flagellimonas sp. S3867 TaxID=2768063 RepID=UPI0016881B3A|nr:DUF6090 family protein [Flagellimonas sp. S3867]